MFILKFIFLLIFINPAWSQTQISLVTPRGAEVRLTAHIPNGNHLAALIVAPGQSCNSKGPLFQTLGELGVKRNLAIYRFEWSYCNSNPERPTPSPELQNEIEDFLTVLNHVSKQPNINKYTISIAGKSLGSVVANLVFANTPQINSLILMTPICASQQDYYPGVKKEYRPVLFALGNKDDSCPIPALSKYLSGANSNIDTVIVGGDHGFRIKDSNGQVNAELTQKNILRVVQSILYWVQ